MQHRGYLCPQNASKPFSVGLQGKLTTLPRPIAGWGWDTPFPFFTPRRLRLSDLILSPTAFFLIRLLALIVVIRLYHDAMNIDLHWFSTASALSRIVYADLLYDKRNGRPSMRIVVYYCYYSVNLVSVFLYGPRYLSDGDNDRRESLHDGRVERASLLNSRPRGVRRSKVKVTRGRSYVWKPAWRRHHSRSLESSV